MNRSIYFNYIEEKLNTLSYRIKSRSKLNLLELNIHSEVFFASLMSKIFNYSLENMNALIQNAEAIDLIDKKNRIIIQVSATCSKQKIEDSLSKEILSTVSSYHFMFIAITGDAKKLREKDFMNPYSVQFSPSKDIFDINSLLSIVLNLEITKQIDIYEFLKQELGFDVNIVNVDTNLASIINILAKENLSMFSEAPEVNAFEIMKKIEFNKLLSVQPIIDDYKIYYSKLDEKYKEFDKQGVNKSFSVLAIIRKQYNLLKVHVTDPHELFFSIINSITGITKNSKNYVMIPYEELEMCVSIIVVDAFIRCKIFENPKR